MLYLCSIYALSMLYLWSTYALSTQLTRLSYFPPEGFPDSRLADCINQYLTAENLAVFQL
jgi:hypothetical protein